MPASRNVPPREITAFHSWLDLPPGYIVNDWIIWQKGKLVAARDRRYAQKKPDGANPSGFVLWLVGETPTLPD